MKSLSLIKRRQALRLSADTPKAHLPAQRQQAMSKALPFFQLKRRSQGPQQQAGVALIAVLLVMSVVVAVIADMALSHRSAIAQTTNILNGRQAWHYGLGAETLAAQLLAGDWENPATREQDNLNEQWARLDGGFPTDFGTVQMRIRDINRHFNVNNLVDDNGSMSTLHYDQLKRMFYELNVDERIAEQLLDWVDADIQSVGGGDEASFYASVDYLPANHKMIDKSEIRLLQEFSSEELLAIEPLFSVAPEKTRVNINTATPEVLRSLVKDIVESDISLIQSEQQRSGYASVQSFLETPEGAAFDGVSSELTVVSDYFEVLARVNYDTSYIVLQSLLKRDYSDGKITVVRRQLWPADALDEEF